MHTNQLSKFKNVIFDLGGVLIDWNPRYLYRQLLPDEAATEQFVQNMFTEEWSNKEDSGHLSLIEELYELCQKDPCKAELYRAYHARWPETLSGEISGTVDILKQLKQNQINLYALTNWSYETFPYARQKFPFLNDFLDIVVSGEEKLVKPHREIYELLLRRNNVQAHESVFVDDRLVNVQGAEAVGIKGVHFTSPEELRDVLLELGILS